MLLALVLVLTSLALAAPLALGASDTPINPMAIEGPVAREYSVLAAEQLSAVATVPVDVAAALAEDSIRERNDLPPRFAIGQHTLHLPNKHFPIGQLARSGQTSKLRIRFGCP